MLLQASSGTNLPALLSRPLSASGTEAEATPRAASSVTGLRTGGIGVPAAIRGAAAGPTGQPDMYEVLSPGDEAFDVAGLRGGTAGSPPDVADHPVLDSMDLESQTSMELARRNPLFQSGGTEL